MTDNEKQEIRQALPSYIESITTRTHSKNRYICPICGSKGDAFVLMSSEAWYCHSCHEHGDIFRLVQLMNHCDFKQSMEIAADFAGIRLEDLRQLPPKERRQWRREQAEQKQERQAQRSAVEDFEDWYNTAYTTLCEYKRAAVFDYKGLLPDSDAHRSSAEKRLQECKGYLQVFENATTYDEIRTLFTSSLFANDISRFAEYLEFRSLFRGEQEQNAD